jgi:hypothetical protein
METTTNGPQMPTLREAAQAALDALQYHTEMTRPIQKTADSIEALRTALAAQQAAPAQAELESLRRDAERYRFLRSVYNIPISTEAARDPVVYDAAIDAAMAKDAP